MFPKIRVLGENGEVVEMILVQGGMGAGISLASLAGAVARRGGVGIVSSVGLDRMEGNVVDDHFESAKREIARAIRLGDGKGMIGINCMAMMHTYRESVRGAVAGGVQAIFVGAGLPLDLPEVVGDAEVALVPIISSAKALDLVCRKWNRIGRIPDAVVLEGPLAGGHLGFRAEDIENPAFQLEEIFPAVLESAQNNGGFPVIVAGGIWDRADILRWIGAGASGVQMGTRFLATDESGASLDFKKAVVDATAEGIIVATCPGSPSGMPFRIVSASLGYQEALLLVPTDDCHLGYMVHGGKCRAFGDAGYFCICKALLTAVERNPDLRSLPIYTVGANAARVDRILSVDDLIDELTGDNP